jgi:ketol-acid reductoisomerase
MILNLAMNQSCLTIVGYGNQACAWAKNLRDSGWNITIALRENSHSHVLCQEDQFKTCLLSEIKDSLVALLIPDHLHLEFLKKNPLKDGTCLILAHGYSLYRDQLHQTFPNLYFSLLAPKAIATKLRAHYLTQKELGGVYSFEYLKDQSLQKEILKLGRDLGLKANYQSSFQEEVYSDLFSEQSLLCSLLPMAALESFETLVKNGVSKELAYLECWHEIKLIADTMVELGPADFFNKISPNALVGGIQATELLIDESFKSKYQLLMEKIKSGQFFDEVDSTDINRIKKNLYQKLQNHPLQKTHEEMTKLWSENHHEKAKH